MQKRLRFRCQGLSLGLAQWNDRRAGNISAKVWRHTGERWSRQSEELPCTGCWILAILVCRPNSTSDEAYRYPKFYDPENPVY